jgi:hypothetical protein
MRALLIWTPGMLVEPKRRRDIKITSKSTLTKLEPSNVELRSL